MSQGYEWNKTWRHKHPEVRHAGKARHYNAYGVGTVDTNSRQRWTPDEDRKVIAHRKSDRELAVELGRTVRAIQQRRNRLVGLSEAS